MPTHLPQNQFISNPSVTPEPPTEGPAVASSDLQPRATAEPFHSSCSATDAHQSQQCDVRETKRPETDLGIATELQDHDPPSNEGRSEGTPASAPTKNPDVGVLATDHIHEIFAGARKLLPPIDIDEDELPLFIRDGDHLRRWEA